MKIEVTVKDPDGFWECVNAEVAEQVRKLGLPEDETEALIEVRTESAWKKLGRWVEYKEYLRVSFDLEAGTATVLENK